MKWVRKTICIFLGLVMITSTALAEIPNYTVIIGNKSFALKYANDEKNIKEIRDALKTNTGKIVIKTNNKWYENNGEIFHELNSLPRVIYTDENGNRCEYQEGNGDKIKGGILSIDLVKSNTIRIKFTQELDKQWISNKENFLINGVELTEEDTITYNEEEGYMEIKLHKKIYNSVEVLMKNIKNLYGEILHEEFKKKIVPKSKTSTNSGGSSHSGGSSNNGGSHSGGSSNNGGSHSGGSSNNGGSDNGDNSNSTIRVNSIVLNETELKMKLASEYQLTAEVLPKNATNKALTWKSSDTSIAKVDQNGKVVAKGIGTAVITVEGANGKSAVCNVTVVNDCIEVEKIKLNENAIEMKLPSEYQLAAEVLPKNATNKALTWKSSNEKIATVDKNGKVTSRGIGATVISVTSNNGKTAKCNVTVLPISVDSVVLEKERTIELGEKLQLVAKIYPSNATNRNLTWTSSNHQIISVDENGILMARRLGTAIITAVSNNSKVATCVVKSVPRSNDLFVNIINNKAVINIFDITETEKLMNLKIMNKVNGNLELIQDYELTPDKMEIELELNPGVYLGEINIVNSRRFEIKTFSID